MPEYHATGHHLFQFEEDQGASEVDFVAGFQPDAARIAVDFAAHAVAYDPDAALGAARVNASGSAAVGETQPSVMAGGAGDSGISCSRAAAGAWAA